MEEYMKADEEYAEMVAAEGEEASFEYYTPLFVLNNPEDSEAFEEEVAPLLPNLYKVIVLPINMIASQAQWSRCPIYQNMFYMLL